MTEARLRRKRKKPKIKRRKKLQRPRKKRIKSLNFLL
jgi:hypothetical protein